MSGQGEFPYFDAHCDTIYRIEESGEGQALEMGSREEQLAYYGAADKLRQNGGHIDLTRTRRCFSRYGQFFALYWDTARLAPGEGFACCSRLHDRFLREMEENRDLVVPCRSGQEVDRAAADGKAAALLSIEGAGLLDCDLRHLETAAAWGVRLLNPVWNRANCLSGSNCENPERGLSERGREFIRRMEALSIRADVSHLSDPGFWDLVHVAQGPVVASHSNARSVCPHPRNLTDDQFKAIRDSGGVVGLNLYSAFVGRHGTMEELIEHVEHFLGLDGEKTLCIGGDMDGCESLAAGMQGCQDMPKLYAALKKRGYGKTLLEDLFWNNLRRII